jgi:phage tail sheath protein FI
VWGARTLSRDVRWQQITSRRIVGMITERVRRDAEWVVFETQRPELWEVVARMVRTRLDGFWRAGLLTGEAEGNEYLVQCDAELNPPSVRDAGQVHFKVLLRPVASTEFIEVELAVGA